MKVLVIGGGSSLAGALLPNLSTFATVITGGRSGCDVALDLTWPEEKFNLPDDLDVVILSAAHFGGDTYDDLYEAEITNAIGVLKLCQACTRSKVRHFLLISSIFATLSEDSPFYGSYALSKKHGDEIASLYCRVNDLSLTILRPSQIYGTGNSFRRHQPFLYHIFDKAENNEDIILFGKNDALRNIIHVEDVAEIVARVVRRRVTGLYNCSSLDNVRYTEIAAAAIAAFDSSSSILFAPQKPDIPDNVFEIDTALYKYIGYSPSTTLEIGISKEVARRRRERQ